MITIEKEERVNEMQRNSKAANINWKFHLVDYLYILKYTLGSFAKRDREEKVG